jgi:lysocardiolipin and lysophospholipid acyltransferase
VPSIGWTHYFQGSLFLARNWQQDQSAIKGKLAEIEKGEFPRPFWIGIYPEGTRITKKKHAESLKFAAERGLPQLNHVLLPRTKGFVTLVQSLPTAINCLYDSTVAYQGGGFDLKDALFRGIWKCKAVHVYLKRIPFKNLPREEENLNAWLMEDFRQKDELLHHFEIHQSFPGGNPVYNTDYIHHLVVWTMWSTLFTGVLYILSGSTLFTTLSLVAEVLTLIVSHKSPPSYDSTVTAKTTLNSTQSHTTINTKAS